MMASWPMLGLTACMVVRAIALTDSRRKKRENHVMVTDMDRALRPLYDGTDWSFGYQSTASLLGSNPQAPRKDGEAWSATLECPAPAGAQSWSRRAEDQQLYNMYFCGKRGGTFVEVGARDGVTLSNTKFYEDTMGWSGALMEAAPVSYRNLINNRGKTGKNSLFGGAVCAEDVHHVNFGLGEVDADDSGIGDMPDEWMKRVGGNKMTVQVPCRPLGGMLRDTLAHTGAKHIDLFSLAAEGGELKVLETMDWSVDVKVWLIGWGGGRKWQKSDLTNVMLEHGYVLSPMGAAIGENAVFVRASPF